MTNDQSPQRNETAFTMNPGIKNDLNNLRFGEPRTYRHLTVLPLLAFRSGSPPYISLAQAMNQKTLIVTEISEGGSVPQLLVLNDGDQPVLIIDGEELLGAKQNRILNTTILLKEKSRTIVPVSCTEQGRWSSASAQFSLSDAVLERKIRSRKSRSVSESLSHNAPPQSDQGEVWEGIQALHYKAGSSSPTSAMHDAFKAQAGQLNECLQAFPCVENQVGLLVLIQGQVAGFDVVSRPEVYAWLHEKLIRSYVLDALLEQSPILKPTTDAVLLGRSFLAALDQTREEVFPSVGYGRDYRYHAPSLTGSLLVHADCPIHASFLSLEESSSPSSTTNLSSLRRRRHFREQ
jgi:hypothetical protein